jgi:hypothetical protein
MSAVEIMPALLSINMITDKRVNVFIYTTIILHQPLRLIIIFCCLLLFYLLSSIKSRFSISLRRKLEKGTTYHYWALTAHGWVIESGRNLIYLQHVFACCYSKNKYNIVV